MTAPIIELDQLTKKYDDQYAVDHLSLTINKGEIFGLLGPNGAGKSTTILMMLGLSEPSAGSVKVCGLNSTSEPLAVKQRVGYLPDDLGFYDDMTGFENLIYTARLNGIDRKTAEERALQLLKRVGLLDAAHKKSGKYSRGMRQRLGLADVLMKKPELIILDEPTLGIDPEGVRELLQLIRHLNQVEGITVLLSSHHLHQVQQICDRVGIFVQGKLLAEGNLEELAEKLYFEDLFVIDVRVDHIDQQLIKQLNEVKGVNRVAQISDKEMAVYGESNITTDIANIIIQTNTGLQYIQQRNYGLDEIYHRYFEGADHSAKNTKS
ncbi:ABC-2 type transport system ATP-binding protein [Gracilibacillus ureilyticus]|uniref:ABC-2 type transport system ATP-binding protein n=1 Tax=Gracilibacillus ureilyticus TaxID=531814 RepID=A0A1H9QAV7_9BACI|nr:ABC transporter ATP-binding protein [Gracilibacillus ureilyticus]SER57532.1 ABC-2 type transport system ATP-binding protein [Gracilibacillus ureilyticus]